MALVLGPVAIGFLVILWTTGAVPTVIAGWSAVALVYFLFFAPSDCLAVTRNRKLCRNNAHGLLRSCHLQQHKRQNLLRFGRSPAGQTWMSEAGELVSTPKYALATAGAVVSLASTLIALMDRIV